MFRKLERFEDSRFYKKLSGDDRSADLLANVGTVVQQSEEILRDIRRWMTQYTLHDDHHILNVLSIMDALTPAETMEGLTPFECALCIMAAYTHDLGMAVRKEEARELDAWAGEAHLSVPFRRHRSGYGDLLLHVERLKKGDHDSQHRARMIEEKIRADFLRQEHVNDQGDRIRKWLQEFIKIGNSNPFLYQGKDFQSVVVDIGLSHGKPARWFREKRAPQERPRSFLWLLGEDNHNLAFPGLLLRLADIMDFDATRAPRILFHHLGIEDPISVREWQKHLSITGINISPGAKKGPGDEPPAVVSYSALDCPHPVCEKTIHEFVHLIESEMRSVREELNAQRLVLEVRGNHYKIPLPEKVDLHVEAKERDGKPLYLYQNVQFHIEPESVQKILMGEALYGDPALCIREMIQNSLDALELRDLRLKMDAAGKEPHAPVDPLKTGETLQATLRWDRDGNTLTIADNGVGMTREVIQQYFARVGVSYYRSSDYHQERALLAENHLNTSPISYFGIGILSCFMVADRMRVRTRPGRSYKEEQKAHQVEISGPGSLFWFTEIAEKEFPRQGTEITLFLKPKFRLSHDAASFERRIKEHFGYPVPEEEAENDEVEPQPDDEDETRPQEIEPAFAAAAQVVWPRYPVVIEVPDGAPIRLDDRYHVDVLVPIRVEAVQEKAEEWGCPKEWLGRPQWALWEWVDNGREGTGSRVRLWFPVHEPPPPGGRPLPVDPPPDRGLCQQDELAAFVESQIGDNRRSRVLVQGMNVAGDGVARRRLEWAAGVGSRLWLDLRGLAMPRLTANRQQTLAPEDGKGWREAVRGVFDRALRALGEDLAKVAASARTNLAIGFRGEISRKFPVGNAPGLPAHLLRRGGRRWLNDPGGQLSWGVAQYIQGLGSDCSIYQELPSPIDTTLPRDLALTRAFDLARDLALDRDLALARDRDRALDLALDRDRDRALDRDLALDLASSFDHILSHQAQGLILQQAFTPALETSWPRLGVDHRVGRIGDAVLVGPGLVRFGAGAEDDPDAMGPVKLKAWGYDLVLPMAAIPLGNLRCACPAWREDHAVHPTGVAPFLFPELHATWPKHADELGKLVGVPQVFALMPKIEMWDKPFDRWTDDDWPRCGLSALWDVATGRVFWAHGALTVVEMRDRGRVATEFFEELRPRRKKRRKGPGDPPRAKG